MNIDWDMFTPWTAMAGGILIGLAATLLILCNGQVAGISGIIARLIRWKDAAGWRWAFLGGLLLAPWIFILASPLPSLSFAQPLWLYAVAGLLVGFGSRLGSGCTSGHGVCGLSRLSRRSFVATAVFMASGFMTVFISHHLIGG